LEEKRESSAGAPHVDYLAILMFQLTLPKPSVLNASSLGSWMSRLRSDRSLYFGTRREGEQ
jgi:hypothetical protein